MEEIHVKNRSLSKKKKNMLKIEVTHMAMNVACICVYTTTDSRGPFEAQGSKASAFSSKV